MPDISMCANEACPLRADCYRSPASGTAPGAWQSWCLFQFDVSDADGTVRCSNFWRKGRSALRVIQGDAAQSTKRFRDDLARLKRVAHEAGEMSDG